MLQTVTAVIVMLSKTFSDPDSIECVLEGEEDCDETS